MDPIRPEVEALPVCIRHALVSELLPEVLHDLNNSCAVLDGIAMLLQSEARTAPKVLERAQGLQNAGESLSKVAWLANGLVVGLGAPLSFPDRDDGLTLLAEVAVSSVERRGGKLTFAVPPESLPLRDSLEKLWFMALLRAFAGQGGGEVIVRSLDGDRSGIVAESSSANGDPAFPAAVSWAADRFDGDLLWISGPPRVLRFERSAKPT